MIFGFHLLLKANKLNAHPNSKYSTITYKPTANYQI